MADLNLTTTQKDQTPARLSTAYLTREEVRSKSLLRVGQCHYSVTTKDGERLPAWQFAETVQEVVGPILRMMQRVRPSEFHAFWVTTVDEFDDLTPAEILAGQPFEVRDEVTAAHQRHLGRPTAERKEMVVRALGAVLEEGNG